MPEQAIIDMPTYTQLKEMMGSDFIAELIDTYNEETAALIEQLGKALIEGDVPVFERSAHSIKSSSASLGAVEFSQLARELEMMGKANELAGADKKVEKLAADFLLVRQSLEGLKNEP